MQKVISPPAHPPLDQELWSLGKNTREWIVSAREVKILKRLHIAVLGCSAAEDGFGFTRIDPGLSQILISCEGSGCVHTRSNWQRLPEGQAYVTPRHQDHAYHTAPGEPWRCCWVTYQDPPKEPPIIPMDYPSVISIDPRPLESAIMGFYAEMVGPSDPAMCERWAQLIDAYVRRAVAPMAEPDRLWRLWQRVRDDLGYDWTLDELSSIGYVSREALRRHCHQAHGHSPLDYVTHLRMNAAADRLQRSDLKIETIAAELGYTNPFAFSRSFKRVMGISPSEFRRDHPRLLHNLGAG